MTWAALIFPPQIPCPPSGLFIATLHLLLLARKYWGESLMLKWEGAEAFWVLFSGPLLCVHFSLFTSRIYSSLFERGVFGKSSVYSRCSNSTYVKDT